MSATFRPDLRRQRGGAVVEFAVFTFVFVPLALYGVWFADTLHFGIKAQEASIVPAWDVSGHLLHDQVNGNDPGGKYSGAINKAKSDITADMGTSLDSTNPGGTVIAQSVVARAQNLTVKCERAGGDGAAPNSDTKWTLRKAGDRQPIDTWVTCRSSVQIKTTGIPTDFMQDRAGPGTDVKLFNPANLTLTLCGIGPGIRGCGSSGTGDNKTGFWLFHDDWGLEKGESNTLQAGSASGNQAYFEVAKAYFTGGLSPGAVTFAIGGFGDQGDTGAFRLSYQRSSDGRFGPLSGLNGSPHESAAGQSNPHGGPANPHTGGPWHEENKNYPNITRETWKARGAAKYMGVKGWPKDGK